MLFDTLMADDPDEADTSYVHLAQSVEIAPDRMSVAFTLRPEARFNDGTPVTAEDVAWTFNTLRDKGLPQYRNYYADVANVAVEGDRRVVFHFKNANITSCRRSSASFRYCRSIGGRAATSPPG